MKAGSILLTSTLERQQIFSHSPAIVFFTDPVLLRDADIVEEYLSLLRDFIQPHDGLI